MASKPTASKLVVKTTVKAGVMYSSAFRPRKAR
jgi:hypothetical protein